MKKTLILSLFFICIGYEGYSQEKNQLSQMINETFLRYIQYEKEWCAKNGKKLNFNGYYISLEHLPMEFTFTEEILDYPFKYIYVSCSDIKKTLKQKRPVLYLGGPIIKGDEIELIVSLRTVNRKRNIINISSGAFWFSCKWKYSVEDNKWKLISEEVGGI
ncbi:MAG: hypothetical protein LUF87_08720 [Alistipes sp.]|nr:hypothetical protein [Alistipes sp.]